MDQILKEMKNQLVNESSIDYPRPGLTSEVWGDDQQMLPEVKEKILNHLDSYTPLPLQQLASKIRVIGSIGTNQYSDDADIDVHLIIDPKDLPKGKTAADYQREAKWFFDQENTMFIEGHPVEIYMQYDPNQEEGYASAIYDLKANEWERGPLLVDPEFNPFDYYEETFKEVQEEVVKVDATLGELFRDVQDYQMMRDALGDLPIESKKSLAIAMNNKLAEMTSDIETLAAYRQEWKDVRAEASSAPVEEVNNSPELRKKWREGNAKFKFIQRYGYMDLIFLLEQLIKEESKVTDSEVSEIEKALR